MTRKRSSRSARLGARRAASRQSGKLRVIGGEFRRRQLPVADRPGLRPTPDRVRETLFNWLGQTLDGKRVLDSFAGTGALGIEALSRGAAQVTFIEQDSLAADQLRRNLAALGASRAHVICQDARAFLSAPACVDQPSFGQPPFDLVLLDPPFYQGLVDTCAEALEAGGWLAPDALIYVEAESTHTPTLPACWQPYRQTQAGDTTARLYCRMARQATLAAAPPGR